MWKGKFCLGMCLYVGGQGFKGIDQLRVCYNYDFGICNEYSFVNKCKLF